MKGMKIKPKEIQLLVAERIKALSSGKKISVGSEGTFSKEEMLDHVQKNDKIGKKIIEIQLSYLRSLKTGLLPNEG